MQSIEKEKRVKEFAWLLTAAIRGKFSYDDLHNASIFAAYALYKAKQGLNKDFPAFSTVANSFYDNEIIRCAIMGKINDVWDSLQEAYATYLSCDIDICKEFILNSNIPASRFDLKTPNSITKLAIKLLDIKDDDTIADFGSGDGGFIIEAKKNNKGISYFGAEINIEQAAIAAIRAELVGGNIEISQQNMFTLYNENKRFNKIFSNYPFGMRLMTDGKSFMDTIGVPAIRSADWAFNLLLVKCLKAGGKAIGIMTNGACFNGADKWIRKYFVENKFIEALIALPVRMFESASIPTVLVVLSNKDSNDNIRMVDASNIFKQGRRQNDFGDDDIDTIINALDKDSVISRTITVQELINDETLNLAPQRFFYEMKEIKNGIEFNSIIKNITRGAQLTAQELDEITSTEPTSFRYLMLRDIQDGVITETLPYLNTIESRLEKYCIKAGNLLLSKNGTPFKVAVVDEAIQDTVLANGNLFIIEIDEARIRPLYLKAFFESERGASILKNISVGTAMSVIQIDALKSLIIPCPPISEQMEVEKQYCESLSKIKELKQQLAEVIAASKKIFSEGE